MNYWYILTLLFSAFTGWLIAWVIVKLLFRPARPVKIFSFTLQGFFPKNQQRIAEQTGEAVSNELFSFKEIEKQITSPQNFEKLKPEIEKHIDNFLRVKLKVSFPMFAMFVGDKTTNQLKDAFLAELEELFPVLMKKYMTQLENDLDLKKMVTEKIASYPIEKLEALIFHSAKKEFLSFKIMAAIFGLLIGIFEVLIMIIIK